MCDKSFTSELQQFPVLRRCMDEVIGKFLIDGLQPAEAQITHIIKLWMNYINTSHPKFIGGKKAVELAQQQVKSSKSSINMVEGKDGVNGDKLAASEKGLKTLTILARSGANGVTSSSDSLQGRHGSDGERPSSAGGSNSRWAILSMFRGGDDRAQTSHKENAFSMTKFSYNNTSVPVNNIKRSFSKIQLSEPPMVLKPSEHRTEQEALEISVTKLLVRSYYRIVRKNVQDIVPCIIMHFLVDQAQRELHNVLISTLYREDQFEKILKEPDEISTKRKHIRETLQVLQQAYRTLDEISLEAETVEKGLSLDKDGTSSSFSEGTSSYSSPRNPRSRNSSYPGEHPSSFLSHANGSGSYLS